jgi:hypothetical protein
MLFIAFAKQYRRDSSSIWWSILLHCAGKQVSKNSHHKVFCVSAAKMEKVSTLL